MERSAGNGRVDDDEKVRDKVERIGFLGKIVSFDSNFDLKISKKKPGETESLQIMFASGQNGGGLLTGVWTACPYRPFWCHGFCWLFWQRGGLLCDGTEECRML